MTADNMQAEILAELRAIRRLMEAAERDRVCDREVRRSLRERGLRDAG